MATAIAPVTPLIPISPIRAFDNRNVIVPLQVINNQAVQDALQGDGGNQSDNPAVFPFELDFPNGTSPIPGNTGNENDVVVPIAAQTPEIADKLEENGGNGLDNGTPPSDNTTESSNSTATTASNRISTLDRLNRLNDDLLARPFNDNFARITAIDTQFPLETAVTLQEAIPAAPAPVSFQGNAQTPFNIYSYTINALQGGLNEASPINENDNNRVEFEA